MTKKIVCLSLIFLMTSIAPTFGADQVGVAGAVKGSVQLSRETQIGKIVESGEDIFLKDEIKTDEKGSLQILLLDETTFTIGANSNLIIDKFVYDPATNAGQVNARVVKGTFRFITGKIARKNPEDMQVALPAGTIGIRGTMVMGKVEGDKSLVMLTGPGDKNNTGSKNGEILVSNDGKTVQIARTGFGTQIEGVGSAPSPPFLVPAEMVNAMSGALSPEGTGESEDAGGEEGSATEDSGQGGVDTGEDLSATESVSEISTALAAETTTAAIQAAQGAATIQDGITTIAQLLAIQTGDFHFEGFNIPLSPGGGSFDFHFDVNYGLGGVGGGSSFIASNATNSNIDGGGSWSFNIPFESFSSGTDGLAKYTSSGLTNPSCATGSCTLAFEATAFNSGGVAAANGTLVVNFTGGTLVSGSGSGSRHEGLS